ncbi:hypothetical protein H2199_007213 [Coniosporium tulheliwenetii]|uniref:Uncharacterized protein n=1 Tax=Coniosporium tulheliwenetii TaxID=3383036 RepID=A0ACC2YQP6_9PEZI|nr:hypothetical protein H2199_007213 [Cladosporium sp. JES 115]
MRLTYLTPLLLPSLVASIAVPPSPASSDGSIAPVTAAPSIPTATLAAPAAPTDAPLDEVDDLELRAVVTAPPAAQPTPAAVPAGAAGPAPFITSWWAATVLPDGATTWVQLVFTQTYNVVPEQLPTPNKGVIGMGTLTGRLGLCERTKQTPHPPPPLPRPIRLPLLSLPAELRNQIYTHLLVPCTTHLSALRRLTTQNHLSDYVLPALDIHPAILATCRQAHTEGTGLLYGANTFSAHPALLTQLPFLVKASRPIVCPAVVGRIRRWHVKVRLDTDPRYSAEDVRKAFSGAEEVEVDVWQTQFGAYDYGNLGLFEEVRGVGRAVVGGVLRRGLRGGWRG